MKQWHFPTPTLRRDIWPRADAQGPFDAVKGRPTRTRRRQKAQKKSNPLVPPCKKLFPMIVRGDAANMTIIKNVLLLQPFEPKTKNQNPKLCFLNFVQDCGFF